MKRILWNITLASILTLAAYIALFAIWGAILSGVENQNVRLILIAIMTAVAYGFLLLYVAKIRKSVGENEVIADYWDRTYTSFADDFKLIIKREARMLVCIAAIILICFALNSFDRLVFGKKTISLPTFLFAPMCLFSTLFEITVLGYIISIVVDCAIYILAVLIYRRKKYNYWMKTKS